jgi:hypothetical protein
VLNTDAHRDFRFGKNLKNFQTNPAPPPPLVPVCQHTSYGEFIILATGLLIIHITFTAINIFLGKFASWTVGQPDNSGKTNGVEFCASADLRDTTSNPNYPYYDDDCSRVLSYICSFSK